MATASTGDAILLPDIGGDELQNLPIGIWFLRGVTISLPTVFGLNLTYICFIAGDQKYFMSDQPTE